MKIFSSTQINKKLPKKESNFANDVYNKFSSAIGGAHSIAFGKCSPRVV